MPIFGGAAKRRYRCAGREFTGAFDDCFNDYLPIAELIVPIIALMLAYPFARFSFSLFASDHSEGVKQSRFANLELWRPGLQTAAFIGSVWCLWRALSYPLSIEVWPYVTFWLTFAVWFALGAAANRMREVTAP